MYANDMKFVDTHEWIKVEQDDVVIIGVTHHAQELLGDVVYVELPNVGKQIKAHEVIGVIESVKAASDLYSPVTGEVVAVNDEVVSSPDVVNTDPHGLGWLIKVKLSNTAELASLMSAEQYKNSIGG